MIEHPRSGYTLLELSIVLIIIGLIMGGIFLGENIMENARIRRSVTQLTSLAAAVHVFEDKYNALPGDMRHPETLFDNGGNGPFGGNGNGRWDDGNWPNNSIEGKNAMLEIALAGLYAAPTSGTYNDNIAHMGNFPLTPWGRVAYSFGYSGLTGVGWGDNYAYGRVGNVILMGDINEGWTGVGNQNFAPTDRGYITPEEAHAIDMKIDDGTAYNGQFRSINTNGIANCTNIPGNVAFHTPMNYNLLVTTPTCETIFFLDQAE